MLALCYSGLLLSTTMLPLPLAFVATTILIALHSSLQHEVLHGHPTGNATLNEALVFPAVGLLIPYQRFRELHLAHHHDEILTDPYDDPESNFLDPEVWAKMSAPMRLIRRFNNILLGRILLGPLLSMIALLKGDMRAIQNHEVGVAQAWILHLLGLVPVIWWLDAYSAMPFWLYLLAAYLGFGLLKIRTYLEHRAHDKPRGRTVIITDRGPLSWLFLNNNYHVVHHSHPNAPWYDMPRLFNSDPNKYLKRNEGYYYANYGEVFRKYFFRAKDPVPHPLWKSRR
ncbi:MAG: fatty acid desaturase [Alphaproteobacteria bacterium]|nr:fatty acid desaturase [Alphaproteobacteria bacterium]